MVRKISLGLLALMALVLLTAPAAAQDSKTLVDGLSFPRGLAYDADGNLFIAEAGSGGEKVLADIEGQQITGGLTGQATMLAPDGKKSVVVGNLTSALVPMEGSSLGLQRVIPAGDSLWLVLSEHQNMTVFSDAVVEIDRKTLRVKHYIDLYAFEAANDPDGTKEINSNPSDVAFGPDGKLYIVDTGANDLLTWTPEKGLEVVKVWNDNPVPTSIEFAKNGDIYIGFLGTGIAPNAGHIEHWSADGKTLIETFANLTAVTDILVDKDGNVYATQLAQLGAQGPVPASGSVVKVAKGGITPVAEGLNTPFGLAQNAEGNLVVSVGSAFTAPDSGAVIEVPLGK